MAVEAAVVFNNNHCSINTNTQQGEEEKVHMDLNRIKAAQAVEAAWKEAAKEAPSITIVEPLQNKVSILTTITIEWNYEVIRKYSKLFSLKLQSLNFESITFINY